jgi:hypothetical protein
LGDTVFILLRVDLELFVSPLRPLTPLFVGRPFQAAGRLESREAAGLPHRREGFTVPSLDGRGKGRVIFDAAINAVR